MFGSFGIDEAFGRNALEHAGGEGVDVRLEEGFEVAVSGCWTTAGEGVRWNGCEEGKGEGGMDVPSDDEFGGYDGVDETLVPS